MYVPSKPGYLQIRNCLTNVMRGPSLPLVFASSTAPTNRADRKPASPSGPRRRLQSLAIASRAARTSVTILEG